MGLFKWSDERIADAIARLTTARDFAGLADELHNGDARRRSAVAAALASLGPETIPAVVAATLPRSNSDDARRGAWAVFKAMGAPASGWVTAAVMSPDTLLADDVPGTLRYWERAVAAIGPASQDDVASLVAGEGPWRRRAEACLEVRDTRDARVNRQPVPSGHILMPISLGEQTISVEQTEEVLRATAREWAVTCFLDLAETDAILHDDVIGVLEEAVLDAIDCTVVLGEKGLPELPPVAVLRRHLAGEKGVLTRLQTDSYAARISPADYPEAERRRREDLLVGTLALASLRNYARKGAGLDLTPALVAQRVELLADPGRDQAASRLPVSQLAALVLCCEMHLGEPASALTDEPSLAPLFGANTEAGTSATIDRNAVLETLRTLRSPS